MAKLLLWASVLLAGLSGVLCAKAKHDPYKKLADIAHRIDTEPELQQAWVKHKKQFEDALVASPLKASNLDCGPGHVSNVPPTSVHALRPGDIKVLAAMGDSITAGNGILAWTIIGCLTEYRGRSWSIGGDYTLDRGVTTLPNIFRKFNDIYGVSTGTGDVNSANSGLNFAVPGNVASDMPGQAQRLVDQVKADRSVDWNNDWKVVTLFVGGNDLCRYCNDRTEFQPEYYQRYLREALDILHRELPRAFVNVVQTLDVTPLTELASDFICDLVHAGVCECAQGSEQEKAELTEVAKAYASFTETLINSGRYDTRDDFTVVSQPFFKDTKPPRKSDGSPDTSYFAPDCFHFSEKGHQLAATALWNNMLEPVGRKKTEWVLGEPLQCPQRNFPYLATRQNSRTRSNPLVFNPMEAVRPIPDENNKNSGETGVSTPVQYTIAMSWVAFIALLVGGAVLIVTIRNRRRRKEIARAEDFVNNMLPTVCEEPNAEDASPVKEEHPGGEHVNHAMVP